jgi:hypothetical protein
MPYNHLVEYVTMRNPVWEMLGAILFAMLIIALMVAYVGRIQMP